MSQKDNQSMQRFINNSESSSCEKLWLENTEYEDAILIFSNYLKKGDFLDIGCGTGEILNYMKEKGYGVTGIEPSKIASENAKIKGLEVYNCDLHEFTLINKKFNIINMTNVLEHIPNPEETIGICKKLLKSNGIIRIKVPNDFNELQLEIVKNLNKNEWWVAKPDHINYFDFQSLEALLGSMGFKIISRSTDFPMELFLLMGYDYHTNKDLGKKLHKKRKNLELNLSGDLRRKIYKSLSEIGLGRNVIIYAMLDS
ncbi:class I SAM-dependent methyltransferase [Clostridium botulinum]|uniref:class I SAM-dependent methyltransferase n=1 Tax=Clostridium botulinum TaxID=1491 RepID=UPI000AF04344|nr:class I SAM-dependent methyltransferase [Clostridium botulinum]